MKENLTRRKALASLGLIGSGAAVGGYGTAAFFSDEEKTVTTFTAGEIDLKLDWKAFHNGEQIALQEPIDADGQIAASLSDVKPGDSGCFSLSIHNETNPAWVWLAMDIVDEKDGGENGSGDNGCPVAEYPWVCGQKETDGKVTITSDEEHLIIDVFAESGETHEDVKIHIADSVNDIPSSPGGPTPGHFEYDAVISDGHARKIIPYSNEGIECGDELVIAVHGDQSDGETCWAGSTKFPGANWAVYLKHTVCCQDSSGNQTNNEKLADNIITDLFWDDDEDCEIDDNEIVLFKNVTLKDLANNISKSTGGIMPEWYSTGTQYISLTWNIPTTVGNEIEGDSLKLKFSAYAEQRRHNNDPNNPWI